MIDSDRALSELQMLARRGRREVSSGAGPLAVWGMAVLAGALLEWRFAGSVRPTLLWLAPVGLGFSLSAILLWRRSFDRRAASWRSRTLLIMWAAGGLAMLLFNLGEDLARPSAYSESEAMTAMVLGLVVIAKGALIERAWLYVVGAAWIAVGAALLVLATGGAAQLRLAGAAVLLLLAPALLLERSERRGRRRG